MLYAEYDATYDAVTCHGKPTQARETTARALWPGVLYAFVTSSTDSDEIGTLQVFGPATAWVSAAPTATSEQLRPHVGSFSYVSVSLRNGRSASITMSLTDLELDAFQRLRTGRASAIQAVRPKRGSVDDPPKEVATARVVVDIDLDGAGGGVVRTNVEKLAASKVVDASLASAARALDASHLGSPAGKGSMAVSTSKSGAVGIHTIPKVPLDRGCRCDPNDSLCDCL